MTAPTPALAVDRSWLHAPEPLAPRRLTLAGGLPVWLRTASAADASLADAFARRLSSRARRLRFERRAPVLGEAALQAFVEPGTPHLALLALLQAEGGEQLAGEARLTVDPDGRNAEFALSVADPLRRRGLGRQLLMALIIAAGQRGVQWLRGETDDDNAAGLALLEELGFMPVRHDEDRGRMVFERRVAGLAAAA